MTQTRILLFVISIFYATFSNTATAQQSYPPRIQTNADYNYYMERVERNCYNTIMMDSIASVPDSVLDAIHSNVCLPRGAELVKAYIADVKMKDGGISEPAANKVDYNGKAYCIILQKKIPFNNYDYVYKNHQYKLEMLLIPSDPDYKYWFLLYTTLSDQSAVKKRLKEGWNIHYGNNNSVYLGYKQQWMSDLPRIEIAEP